MRSLTSHIYHRRDFLQAIGGASTAAAAALAAPMPAAQAYDPGQDETRPRYRESEHIKTFYRTNGYEGVNR
jgi:hypothetical protein